MSFAKNIRMQKQLDGLDRWELATILWDFRHNCKASGSASEWVNQIIALLPARNRPDKGNVACLICGRRTSASCKLVIKSLSCHWCEKALDIADQIFALFDEAS